MWNGFRTFLDKPFSAEMDALDWFLFLGMLIIIMILWRIILKHIGDLLS